MSPLQTPHRRRSKSNTTNGVLRNPTWKPGGSIDYQTTLTLVRCFGWKEGPDPGVIHYEVLGVVVKWHQRAY